MTPPPPPPPDTPGDSATADANIWTVSALSAALKKIVEDNFSRIRIRAEISRVSRPASGHVYFDLKDSNAVLAAVCWRGQVAGLAVQPEEGLEVIITGRLTTYGGQSKYQIVVNAIEVAGEGALLKQLEERRRRLAAEGLFDRTRKKPIPAAPAVIGVVTSPSGAVIRDILHRLGERYPVHVLVWPVAVQGEAAAGEITAAIRGFDALAESPRADIPTPDTVIVARGGGSTEDLMAFNDEAVVRAIAACRLPVISSIGHETDTPLADHAADLRAPTPTAAAEYATPMTITGLQARLDELSSRMLGRIGARLDSAAEKIRSLARALADPAMLIESKAQRLDMAAQRLDAVMESMLGKNENRIATATRLLEAASFERTLERGFAVVRVGDGVMSSVQDNPEGGAARLQFADGMRDGVIEKKK